MLRRSGLVHCTGRWVADNLRCSVIIIKAAHQDWIVGSSPFILALYHPGPGWGPNNTISVIYCDIYLLHTIGYVMLCSISLSASEKLAAVSCSYHVDETFDLTPVREKFTFHTVGVVVLVK